MLEEPLQKFAACLVHTQSPDVRLQQLQLLGFRIALALVQAFIGFDNLLHVVFLLITLRVQLQSALQLKGLNVGNPLERFWHLCNFFFT